MVTSIKSLFGLMRLTNDRCNKQTDKNFFSDIHYLFCKYMICYVQTIGTFCFIIIMYRYVDGNSKPDVVHRLACLDISLEVLLCIVILNFCCNTQIFKLLVLSIEVSLNLQ